jgi:hypothetical protein
MSCANSSSPIPRLVATAAGASHLLICRIMVMTRLSDGMLRRPSRCAILNRIGATIDLMAIAVPDAITGIA